MFNEFMIIDILDKYPMIQVKEVSGFSDALLLIIDMGKVSPVAKRGMISHRQVNAVLKKIRELLGVKVFVSYSISAQKENIESGLKALASANFKRGKVVDLDISFFAANEVNMYTFCKDFSENDRAKWEKASFEYLSSLNIKISEFVYEQKINPEPSLMIILRLSKKIFPYDLGQLSSQIESSGYNVISADWLNAKLDLLRKKGLLNRDHAGVYRLTQAGLEAVPVTKSRQSSDIERILHLARKHL